MPSLANSFDDLLTATRDADLLVTHTLSYAGHLLGRNLPITWVSTVLSPMVFMSGYDPPPLPPAPWLQSLYRLNPSFYRLVFSGLKAWARGWSAPVRRFCKEHGLPEPAQDPLFEGQFSPRMHDVGDVLSIAGAGSARLAVQHTSHRIPPHSYVFPRAAAVIHHGGIGTLGQAMHAGRPMLVVPFSHDQPDNAQRVERMGIGKRIPRAKFSVSSAEAALRELLEDCRYAVNATEIARRLREEDGVAAACDRLEAVLG